VYLIKGDSKELDIGKVTNKLEYETSKVFDKNNRLALKLHFGERKSDTYLDPDIVKPIYGKVKDVVDSVDLIDCNVLYKSDRSFGNSHYELAKGNGWNFAPIVIGDGEKGEKESHVEVNLKHFDKVRLGGAIEKYDSILSVAHFTGHEATGFGGALKNIGMGLGSKHGKLEMHKAFELELKEDKCKSCGKCSKECPVNAISVELKKDTAVIDYENCIGCGRCIAVCPYSAIQVPWDSSSSRELQERLVEYAFGALKEKKSYFLSFILNVTEDCDCARKKQKPIVDDIGVAMSKDIVALDQASLDLVGQENLKGDVNPRIQIEYAQKIGLGTKKYDLFEP